MGASDITVSGHGQSMREAFTRLQDKHSESFHQDFSTISDYTDLTAQWKKAGDTKAIDFLSQAEQMHPLATGEVNGVCILDPTQQREGVYLFVGWVHE